ncbi:MAG: hypothetical protein HY303_03605 [Candidatus Wallbacteria bacterium]|nr:hypothetical protein [Candidatus Wallbacteria bacterium]
MARLSILSVLVLLLLTRAAGALEIKVVAASPDTEVRRGADKTWAPACQGTVLHEGDYVSTGLRASMVLEFAGPAYVLVQGLTQLQIEEHHREKGRLWTQLYLRIGAVRVKMPAHSARRQNFVVATNTGTASIDAQEKRVSYAEEFGTRVEALSGGARARARRDGEVRIASGQTGRLLDNRAFSPREVYREQTALSMAPAGADDTEVESTREFNQVNHRPLADPTTPSSVTELASLFSADSALVMRFEVLTAP